MMAPFQIPSFRTRLPLLDGVVVAFTSPRRVSKELHRPLLARLESALSSESNPTRRLQIQVDIDAAREAAERDDALAHGLRNHP